MTQFFKTAALGAAMMACTAPALAAPAFQAAGPASVGAAADQSWNQYGDRYDRDRREYSDRRDDRGYQGRVWRGRDGRYHCRRANGTTGLLIGGAVGGLVGNSIAGRGGDRTLGTILGVTGGALLGREIDRSGSRCR